MSNKKMKPNPYISKVLEILDSPTAPRELEEFVMERSKQGETRQHIYNALLAVHTELEDGKQYDLLGDFLDRLSGFCAKDQELLSEEAIEYRSIKYTCRCCGYKTLDKQPPGTYQICPVCYWEDDPVQSNDPTFQAGANHVSLQEAQHNFIQFGAIEKQAIQFVRRPTNADEKDENYTPYLLVQITKIVSHDFPGFIECSFVDVQNKEWNCIEKIPVITKHHIDENTVFPEDALIAITIEKEWMNEHGKKIATITTEKPWGVESVGGETRFNVYRDQINTIY